MRVSELADLKRTINNLNISKTTYQNIEIKLV